MNTQKVNRFIPITAATLIATTGLLVAGPLNPPAGPIASTGKTTQEIFDKVGNSQPRIPVSATTTPGDADSVFKITQPGSYYVTANLAGVVSKHGIEVAANDVTLDLNGFELLGVAGSLNGVVVASPAGTLEGFTILNGVVRQWGGTGVNANFTTSTTLHNVKTINNGSLGIYAPASTKVTGCIAKANGAGGMVVGGAISDCTASDNDGYGMNASGSVSRCAANFNTGSGFVVAQGIVSECEARFNSLNGIDADLNSVIFNNFVTYSGVDNIRVDTRCVVRGNNCGLAGQAVVDGAGVRATGTDNRIEDNNCTFGDRGIRVDAAGNIIIKNSCSGNSINWVLAANNVFGPIVDRTAPASAAVSGNSAASSLGSTDANANFTY